MVLGSGNHYLRTEAQGQEGTFLYSEKQQQKPERERGEGRKRGERGKEREQGCIKRR